MKTKKDIQKLLPAVVDELRRLASADRAPSMQRYDAQRRRGLPSSRLLRQRGVDWVQLVEQAGLQPAAPPRPSTRSNPKPLERVRREDALPQGLPVVDSSYRKETFYVYHNGALLRVVRESVSLR